MVSPTPSSQKPTGLTGQSGAPAAGQSSTTAKAPSLVQTSDCSVSVQARVQTATFNVDANVTKEGFSVARIQRKNSGGEVWPMTDKEALEYSAAIASFAATAERLRQQLKEFRL